MSLKDTVERIKKLFRKAETQVSQRYKCLQLAKADGEFSETTNLIKLLDETKRIMILKSNNIMIEQQLKSNCSVNKKENNNSHKLALFTTLKLQFKELRKHTKDSATKTAKNDILNRDYMPKLSDLSKPLRDLLKRSNISMTKNT
ncbi:hypothetical protein FF38_09034 [Lucilia cuprina]|uniref:Uncharacterized protein n=1 Tax=Lucilia cuprina TaxID=7375 RepID=A0A0L0BS93_LUCCU|nr:hypothetical protein FF38_09034 [Lucilia cuprina]